MTDTSPPQVDPVSTEALDGALKQDPGFALEPASLAAFAAVASSDRPLWARIQAVLRKHHQLQGVKVAMASEARSERATLSLVGPGTKPDRPFVAGVIPGAPVSEDDTVPPGWQLADEIDGGVSLYRVVSMGDDDVKHVPVLSRPAVVSAWITNETTHNKAVEVSWKALGKWRRAIVDLRKLSDGTKIVDALAGHGFPVTSNNRADVVQWFADYLAVNVRHIAVKSITEQMGWFDSATFVLGTKSLSVLNSTIEFCGADSGDLQLADAVSSSGDPDEWRSSINLLRDFPRVRLAVCASLATPLLRIVSCKNFILDFAYRTTSGKTSALKVAASVWGCPDENSARSMVASWRATPVWIERAAATRSDLPLIIDDTKRAGVVAGKSIIPGIIYDVANGEGKGRGSIAGTQATKRFRTIMLSSGEHRMIDESKDAGTAARVVTIWGNPWGGSSQEIARTISRTMATIDSNYGHAGRDWVNWILSERDEWEEWAKRYTAWVNHYTARLAPALGDAVSSRVSKYLAVIKLADELSCDAEGLWLNVGGEPDCVDRCLGDIAEGPKDTDRALEALRLVCDWATSNRGRFATGPHRADRDPPGGWLGRWDLDVPRDQGGPWDSIGIVYHELRKVLSANGHEPESIIRLWGERGWLMKQADGKNTKRVRMAGELAHVIAVSRDAIDSVFCSPVPPTVPA